MTLSKTNLFFILFKLFWKLLLLFERANCKDFSSSSSNICRELLRSVACCVGCGFGLNDHRFVAKSNPPRVNDVSNTESFSDSELIELALFWLRGFCIGKFVEDWLLGSVFLDVGTFSTFLTGDLPRCLAVLWTGFEVSFDFDFRGIFCLRKAMHGSVITLTGLKVNEVSAGIWELTLFSFCCFVFRAYLDLRNASSKGFELEFISAFLEPFLIPDFFSGAFAQLSLVWLAIRDIPGPMTEFLYFLEHKNISAFSVWLQLVSEIESFSALELLEAYSYIWIRES